jgi:transcriptional regulator
MEPEIVCVPSAYKHGYTMDDIKQAYRTKIFEDTLEGKDGVYIIIGFDTVANPVEVFYNNIDDETIRVFHAMALRDKTAALMN